MLGLVDYLFATYPTKFNHTVKPKLGIFGASMGAAGKTIVLIFTQSLVALIALEKNSNLTSAFLDSGVCDVYSTLKLNTGIKLYCCNTNTYTEAKSAGVAYESVLSGACTVAASKSRFGCPNPTFPDDPIKSLKAVQQVAGRYLHFDHCSDDTFVPAWNSDTCSDVAVQRGFNVSKFYAQPPTPVALRAKDCSQHVVLLFDTEVYARRIARYFNTTLR